MSADRDIERLLDTWFADGPMRVSDHVFDEAVGRVHRQRQRPAWRLLWKEPHMSPFKVALGAAAILVVFVAGFAVVGRSGGLVGGNPMPTSSPSPSPSPSPSVSAASPPPIADGPLQAGVYHVAKGSTTTVGYELTLPDGWIGQGGGHQITKRPDEPGELGILPFVVDKVFVDPCGPDDQLTVGATAEDLAAALMGQPGAEKSSTEATLGGQPATLVKLTYPAGLDPETCDPPIGLQILLNAPADDYLVLGPDATIDVYLADIGGRRVVITSASRSGSTPSDIAELQAILSSIQFDSE